MREAGSRIVAARARLYDVPVLTPRTDAIQSFASQETIFVELTTRDGVSGRGYAYTIGSDGTAVLALLKDHLLDKLIDLDAANPEAIWRRLHALSRSLMAGPVTALALAAIDTAVWDARGKQLGVPLWQLAGGAQESVPVYDTEGAGFTSASTSWWRAPSTPSPRGVAGSRSRSANRMPAKTSPACGQCTKRSGRRRR